MCPVNPIKILWLLPEMVNIVTGSINQNKVRHLSVNRDLSRVM